MRIQVEDVDRLAAESRRISGCADVWVGAWKRYGEIDRDDDQMIGAIIPGVGFSGRAKTVDQVIESLKLWLLASGAMIVKFIPDVADCPLELLHIVT